MYTPLTKFAAPVLSLPRFAKRMVVLIIDMGLCVLTVWLAYYLRLGEFIALSGNAMLTTGLSMAIALPVFIVMGLYRAIFRYSGWPALLAVAQAIGIYGLLYASIFTAMGVSGVPRTIGIIQPILLLLFVGASRAFARVWLGDQYRSILKQGARAKVLIYGAGSTGRQLVAAMANSHEMQVVGFLDDDDRLHGHVLNGQPIYNPVDLNQLVATLGISDVLLAMPGLNRKSRNDILIRIRAARVAVRTLPSMTDWPKEKSVCQICVSWISMICSVAKPSPPTISCW
jgi:FlaA1/EpsC-like NDP-sugar epimerase